MTSSNKACRAKNPSTCRFHGANRLAPQESKAAYKEVANLSAKLRHPSVIKNTEQFLEIREQLKEAEANYSITKDGYTKLQQDWEDATEANIHSPSEANAMNQFKAANAYFSATSSRQSILEEYSTALVETKFEDKTDRAVADFAMLNKFAQFEAEDELEGELGQAGINREAFYSKIQEPEFSKKLTEVESKFAQTVHETKDPEKLKSSANERLQLLTAQGEDWDTQIYKMADSYAVSLAS